MAEQNEIDKNYEAFRQKLPELLVTHAGKFALMRDAEIVEFFDTVRDAFVTGQKLFSDQRFSVQEVTDAAIDLGFFSHALPQREIRS
jgi:hypothetical protein